jgi:hypothetical protein
VPFKDKVGKRGSPEVVLPADYCGNSGGEGVDPLPEEEELNPLQTIELNTLQEAVEEMFQLTTADSQLLVFNGVVAGRTVSILVDSGASTQFMSETLANELSLPLTEKKVGNDVRLGNGDKIRSNHFVRFLYSIGPFSEIEKFHILNLAAYDLVLGRPWLNRINPDVDWPNNRIRIVQGPKCYLLIARVSDPLERSSDEDPMSPDDVQNPEVESELLVMTNLMHSCEADTAQAETTSRKVLANTSPKFKARLETLLKDYEDVVPSDPDFKFPFPPKRTLDFEINVIPHEKIPSKVVYKMSPIEQEELRKQMDELIERGFIRPSQSPYGSPVLFVKKKNGQMRMCVDYRAINALTVKWKYPIPDINMLLDQLRGARYFTKIDLNQAYYQIRVAENSKKYTAMLTRWGLWEWNCMSFGLSNAPSHFSRLMMDVFKEFIDKFLLVFLDDLLIYSRTEEEHIKHIEAVLRKLREHCLFARAQKCDWGMEKIDFLGHVVSHEGISTDPSKVESVRDWPVPKTRTEVLAFKGLASYYRRFVSNFSEISGPLSALTSEKVPFIWGKVEQESFDNLKQALITAPVLMAPDPAAPYLISTDASGFAIGGVLSQQSEGEERVVAYESRRLNSAERNYPTHDRELLAVMEVLRKWRHYIQNGHQTKVYTDNIATKYILTKPTLMGRQKKWAEQLADYDVEFLHRAGKLNVVADALSRRIDYTDTLNSLEFLPIQNELIEDVQAQARLDNDYQVLVADVVAGRRKDYKLVDNLLYKDTRLVIPSKRIQESLIEMGHDGPLGGHLGRNKTLERLSRAYYWSRMSYDVQEYCRTCPSCQLNKPAQQKQIGLLQPLPIPSRPWDSIGIDFITGLPVTKEGYSVIMTVVDRLSKFLVILPTVATFGAQTVADLFMQHVVKRFGFPISIVSDRDPRFISAFWKELMEMAGVKRTMSSAAHPQTDGVTEQANRTIASMIRSYTQNRPTEWASSLAVLEVAYNDSVNASTGYTPYFLCSGTNPILPLSLYSEPTLKPAATADKAVSNYVKLIHKDIAAAREAMLKAQANTIKYANRSRREWIFTVGDLVLLSEGHFKDSTHGNLAQAEGSTKKLNAIFRGPFKIKELISDVSCRLELPAYMKGTHNAFHVSRLRPYLTTDAFPGRAARLAPPEPTMEDLEQHFDIEEFCGHRLTGRGGMHMQILVQYKGYHEKEWQFCLDLSAPPGLDKQTYLKLLMQYASRNPGGTGIGGRPPQKEAKINLQLRLQNELHRAEKEANAELKKIAKKKQDTVLHSGKKLIVRQQLERTDEDADLSRGGGKRTDVTTTTKPQLSDTNRLNQVGTTTLASHAKIASNARQQPNPLRTGTRAERAAARAYVADDRVSTDTLIQDLTRRNYRTRSSAN